MSLPDSNVSSVKYLRVTILWHFKSYVSNHVKWLNTKGEPPQTWNLCIKNCAFTLTCLNFSHLQSPLHLMQYTYQDFFPTAQNSFCTCQFGCLLVLLLFFVSPLPHLQNISLWGLFSSRETKKSCLGWDWVKRGGRAQGSCCFGSTTAEHSAPCGQVCSCITHHEMGKCTERVSQNTHWSRTQPLTTTPAVHGHRWVPRTLP